eukprot:TRINITY_DN10222_c0_g1_i1.p1 TRINITY_DN10222_c0_g1~~TRINITY_DN10222_c0_g1_i1.p1  ORF type:complete len:389 (-),score=74.64 TRINITY_DN10222_c0_g1_i1:117-1283(-)
MDSLAAELAKLDVDLSDAALSGSKSAKPVAKATTTKAAVSSSSKTAASSTSSSSKTAGPSNSVSSSSVSATKKANDEEIERLKRELEAAKAKGASLTAASKSATKSDSIRAMEGELREIDSKKSTMDSKIGELSVKAGQSHANLQKALKLCDVCFLMDCTGSMGSWISQCKANVATIMEHVATMSKGQALLRCAFVAYRDIGDGALRFQVFDFVEKDRKAEFTEFMGAVVATGGADGPEDIAGGFQKVLGLNWRAATRLVIHFADAPCHGSQYHNMGDDYPGGDPEGKVPEDLLLEIVAQKGCEYYFAKINESTTRMLEIFNAKLSDKAGKKVVILPVGTHPEKFMPLTVKTIVDSMKKSVSRRTALASSKGLPAADIGLTDFDVLEI